MAKLNVIVHTLQNMSGSVKKGVLTEWFKNGCN